MQALSLLSGMTNTASQAALLAQGMRKAGIDAKSFSWEENPYAISCDKIFDMHFSSSMLNKVSNAQKMYRAYTELRDAFDIYYFHSGSSLLPENKDLGYLSRHHRLFMEFHGTDLRQGKTFVDTNPYYKELPQYISNTKLIKKNKHIFSFIEAAIVHDKELELYLPDDVECVYVPLRINLEYIDSQAKRLRPALETSEDPIKVVHIPSKRNTKGSAFVLNAFEKLNEIKVSGKRLFECMLLEDLNHAECLRVIAEADIYLDQLLIGSYGVAALEAMSLNTLCLCYLNPIVAEEYPKNLPLVQVDKDNLIEVLKAIALERESYAKRARSGRKFVECYHEYKKLSLYAYKQITQSNKRCRSVQEAFAQQIKE